MRPPIWRGLGGLPVTILFYLLVPLVIVLLASFVMWARNRQPTSLQSGVDDFRREMQALSPDALKAQRDRAARPSAPLPPARSPRSPRSGVDDERRAESG